MAVFKYSSFSYILMLIICVATVRASKLNVPRILLPIFREFSVNFTLEATEGGCYKWTTTRVDIVQITPIDEDESLRCSSEVIISTISREQARNLAVVLAEDVHTNQILRCDVIVDVIDSLSITTTARELFMEEAPEAFEVRAYDNQGNEFTSLEGVTFDWKIVCLGPNKDQTVLRLIRFQDSPYETPRSVEALEAHNKRGHIVLLEGIKTGSARVIVSLPYKEYKHVKPSEVSLSIIANLFLMPADVYMMVGDVIKFKVILMNNGRMEEIQLPDKQYFLAVESDVVALADERSGEVTALVEGRTKVVLHDRNIDETDVTVKSPSAVLNVVSPSYMVLTVLPYRNWVILVGNYHDIVAEVFSSNDHKMHIGAAVQIHMQVEEGFHVQQKTLNGSWLTGWAETEGIVNVKAVLKSVIHPKRGEHAIEPALSAQNELLIYPRITLSPCEVILPWDPTVKPKYDIQITATGGDGKFLWSSSNHSVGAVTQTGVVRTYSYGFFEVSAAMMSNHHNRETAKFLILPPIRLEIVEYVMEAEVGATIFLHVALYAKKPNTEDSSEAQIPFTRCQELPIKVRPSDNKFVENKTATIPPVGISCANVAVVALCAGSSKITVSYVHNGLTLEDSVTITAYKPLKLQHPKCPDVVLAIGTNLQLVFTGGPRPLISRPSEFNRTVYSEDTEVVTAKDTTGKHSIPGESDFTVVEVVCLKLGETDVVLSVGNSAPFQNCKNQDSVLKTRVICGKPRSVHLQPRIKIADIDSCPMDISMDRVVVQSYEPIEVDVIVRDDLGKKFNNISSLKFEWTLQPSELGALLTMDGTFQRYSKKGTVIFGNDSYQTVTPKAQTGTIDITTKIIGYHDGVLKKFAVTPESPPFLSEDEEGAELAPITAALSLYLVDETVVTPDVIYLYNYPGNREVVSVKQGSGYYELVLSSTQIAEVNYLEGNRQVEVKPIGDGELTVHVVDLCLVSQPAVVVVYVISVHLMRVEVSDKVEVGRCVSCILRLYDENDNLMTVPDVGVLNVNVEHGSIISVEKLQADPEAPWPKGELHYVVTGVELGDTKLVFSVGDGDRLVESAPVDVQVFPPLRVYPRNGTLLIGSTLQFTSKGGPQPDSNIEYTAVSGSVADIKLEGLAKGLTIGQTSIHAKAVGINPSTGQKVLYSQDTVDLQVIPMTGLRISAPLTRFQAGTMVTVWASGIPDQLSPIVLGSVDPPIAFNWYLENTKVAKITCIFCPLGIEYKPQDQISIRVHGLSPGFTRLYLNATVPKAITGKKCVTYTASVDIEVFEKLVLINPKTDSGSSLLMAPKSMLQLKTNLDLAANVEYSLPGAPPTHSSKDKPVLKEKALSVANPVVSVSETGLVQSFSAFGHAMIIITATDNQGLKQTLTIVIEVKPIHYMILSVASNWHVLSQENINFIPLGTEFELRTTYHDNVGNYFAAGTVPLNVRNSRLDLVWVRQGRDNSSFVISTKKPGHTVLKVWADGVQKTVDYVKLNVQQAITPVTDYLTSGDIICLYTPVMGKDPDSTRWTSSERSIITVDQATGVARVVSTRGGIVSLTHSLHPASSLQLTVLPVSKIVMLPEKGKILTNTPEGGVYQVPLVLLSDKCDNKMTNLINSDQCKDQLMKSPITFPFKCSLAFSNTSTGVDVAQVFVVKSNFDFKTGSYCCDILPGSHIGPNISTLRTKVSIWATSENPEIESDHVELPFIPSIFVEREVFMDDSMTVVLEIYGLKKVLEQVTVKAVDENILKVGLACHENENIMKQSIQLVDWHWKLNELDDAMTVIVTSKMTEQTIRVHVKAHPSAENLQGRCGPGQQSFLSSFFYKHRQSLLLVFSMVVIFLITFYAYSNYVQPVVNVNLQSNRAGVSPCPPYYPSPVASQLPTCMCGSGATSSSLSQSMRYNTTANNISCVCGNDPVYGNPSQFYTTSPELRRNRRFM